MIIYRYVILGGEVILKERKISKRSYEILKQELEYYSSQEIITRDKKESILNLYEVKEGLNFIKVLVLIGSILIGAGVLSFIASNWQVIGKPLKFAIVLFFCGGIFFTGARLEEEYEKTGRALIYVSILIYGAGIFLIGQMFNYGGDYTNAFFIWSLGILPITYILKDKLIFIFSHILIFVYINGAFSLGKLPIAGIIMIAVFYYINKYFNYSRSITFGTNILVITMILQLCIRYDLEGVYILIIFLAIGLLMYYGDFQVNNDIFNIQGIIIFGISGVFLTINEIWNDLYYITNGDSISIIFAVCYLIFLLNLTRKGSLTSLLFICVTIIRYYFDTMYDFMPKSLFFIIGGLILLGFGYYFERMRRKKGGIIDENQ